MLRLLLAFLFSLLSLSLSAATPPDTVISKAYLNALEQRIQKLESSPTIDLTKERLDQINNKIDELQEETDRSADGIANQIAASSNFLTIWGYIFTVVGIAIAAFVGWMESRSAAILERSKSILKSQEAIEVEVHRTQEAINGNLTELYQRLQSTEIDYIMARLEKEPRDIANFISKLATVTLPVRYFYRLEPIANKAGIEDGDVRSLMMVIIQHFPDLWLKNALLKGSFIKYYDDLLPTFFPHETEEQVSALAKHLTNTESDDQDNHLAALYIAFYCGHIGGGYFPNLLDPRASEYKNRIEPLFEEFYTNLSRKDLRFALGLRAVELTTNKANFAIIYGKYLVRDYKSEVSNNADQKKLIEEVEKELLKFEQSNHS